MIANSAFLAGMVMLVIMFLLMGELDFLAPYRDVIVERHLRVIVAAAALLFMNVFSLFYLVGRALFLKETGRKLAHVEKQLHSGDSIVADLSERLGREG